MGERETGVPAACQEHPSAPSSLRTTLESRCHYPHFIEKESEAHRCSVWSQRPWVSCRWKGLVCAPPLPACFLAAASYLTHTAAEGSANVGGRGQLHGGLHTTKVEEGVQVEALALARRGTQHRASAIHPQAAVLVEALGRYVVPAAQGQRLRAPQNSQSWRGRQAGLAREWPPALPHLTQGLQGGNFLQPPGVPQGTQERSMDLPEVTQRRNVKEQGT